MIKVLALDIDGVLTDGTVTLDEGAHESKTISFRDVDAIYLARRKGLKVVLVTGERTPWVSMIARRLEIESVYQGALDKAAAIQQLANDLGVTLNEICYVGDSPRDIPALEMSGLGFAPVDAVIAKTSGSFKVLQHPGGKGAVAEAVEIVLSLK